MKITREQFKNIVKEVLQEENEYQEFFKRALEKTGKSIPDMSDEEKKAFFNKIDAAWQAKGEKNEELVGNQHKLDVDGDGEIEASDLAALRAGKKVDEAVSSKDMDKIKAAVQSASSFMGVGSELKKIGMKYTFATEPLPIYIIQPTPNNKVAIVNKKYASKPDFVHNDIAVGVMEGVVKEASSKEKEIYAKIEKLRVLSNSGKITGDEFLDKFMPLWKQLKGMKESVNEIIKTYKPGDGEEVAKIYSGHLKGDERYSHALTVVDILHANGLVTRPVAKKMEQELANSLARLRRAKELK